MSHEKTRERLHALRLYAMSRIFCEQMESGKAGNLEPSELVAMMVDSEYLSREQGKYERARKRANFKVQGLSDLK